MRESWTWHGMTHLLLSQQNKNGSKGTEEGHSGWIWHGMTHFLSSHQDQIQIESEDSEKGDSLT